MNLVEELQSLDVNDIGRWPAAFRYALIGIIFAVAVGLGYYLFIKDKIPVWEAAQLEETQLKTQFENKQRKAANFNAYREQLAEMERSFGAMLRQLPGRTEIPSLLVDISQTGLAAGLEEKLFQPEPEIRKDFYAEKPIRIRLTGSFHQFGSFVSGVAALPRIVTLHDINIKRENTRDGSGDLELNVTAKTYRYLDDDEEAAL